MLSVVVIRWLFRYILSWLLYFAAYNLFLLIFFYQTPLNNIVQTVTTALRRPGLLQPGDRVRIVAPSGPVVERERFSEGIAWLREIGLQPDYDDDIFARSSYLAGSDERRRAELLAALADDTAAAIWFARGGYGATRLLPYLSAQQVAGRPRWLIGFSDATALHGLWQRAGLQSLHAANITGVMRWSEPARTQLYRYLFTGWLPALQGTVLCGHEQGCVQGILSGGNLTVLAALAGTGYLPVFAGTIVFLEDVAERPYRLDRYLTQLCQSGAFAGVRGFVIGQLTRCVDPPDQDAGCSALDAIHSVLAPLGVPILADLAVGHESSSLPLPLGNTVILDMAARQLRLSAE
jgi:muramoyltetrapeptide carboxypeptidase